MCFLDAVEKAGNAMPNPATLFLILTALVMVISAICAKAGVSVTYETIDTANGNALVETTVKAVNLLSVDNIRVIVTKVISNFTSFFALGTGSPLASLAPERTRNAFLTQFASRRTY